MNIGATPRESPGSMSGRRGPGGAAGFLVLAAALAVAVAAFLANPANRPRGRGADPAGRDGNCRGGDRRSGDTECS